MKPTIAEGGEVGLYLLQHARAAGGRFPLVLLDSRMPEMDGFTVATQMKESPGLAGATVMM